MHYSQRQGWRKQEQFESQLNIITTISLSIIVKDCAAGI